MHRVHRPDWRFWLRAVNALALILVAFAHAPIDLRAGEFQQAALQAFPDGSVPVICVSGQAGEQDQHPHHHAPCDACIVSGSMAAIAAPAQIRDTFDLRGPVVMASDDAVLRTFADWNSARPRAPPSA